jgi:hypothetical protein
LTAMLGDRDHLAFYNLPRTQTLASARTAVGPICR